MRYCQLVAAATLAAMACSVQAQSSVVIAITNPTETDRIVNDPVVAIGSLVLSDSSAAGYANLETGILRSESIGPPIQPGLGYPDGQFSSQSAAQIVDTITFGAGASGTGFLDWHVDGTLTPAGNPFPSATTSLVLGVGGTGETDYFTDSTGLCVPSATCNFGTSFNKTGAFAFTIAPGSFQISAFLQTEAFDGAIANFSNTGTFYLRLPGGVTYTSTSGVFLTEATPIFPGVPAVPEPSSYALLLGGLGLLGLVKGRVPSRW